MESLLSLWVEVTTSSEVSKSCFDADEYKLIECYSVYSNSTDRLVHWHGERIARAKGAKQRLDEGKSLVEQL